jgi:hypothetical protein
MTKSFSCGTYGDHVGVAKVSQDGASILYGIISFFAGDDFFFCIGDAGDSISDSEYVP